MVSILIKNALIPDFSTKKFIKRNIVIENDKIVNLLLNLNSIEEKNFYEIIDAKGLIVSPGFIDVHSHSDLTSLNMNVISPKLMQGVTTEIVGNCGLSVVPVNNKNKSCWRNNYISIWGNPDLPWLWTDTFSYLMTSKNRCWNNIETLLGYSTLRFYLTGLNKKNYDKKLLSKMEELICTELEKGALGISIGIGYAPNIYAQQNEYELITKLLKKYNKILTVHLRDEGDNLIQSIKEIISYNKNSNCKLHISHIKSFGKNNWYKNKLMLNLIDKYNKKFDITFDAYPYTAGSTMLLSLLPPVILDMPVNKILKELQKDKVRKYISNSILKGDDGWSGFSKTIGFENIFPSGLASKKYFKFEGLNLLEISKNTGKNIVETLCDILIEEKGKTAMIEFGMNENKVIEIFKHPKQMVASDGIFGIKPHPRTFGAFPRVISRFCNELKIFDLMTALYKMTKFPAERFLIKSRGEIRKNYFADIVIFNPDTIKDKADYVEPCRYPEGIEYIIVNGKIKFSNQKA